MAHNYWSPTFPDPIAEMSVDFVPFLTATGKGLAQIILKSWLFLSLWIDLLDTSLSHPQSTVDKVLLRSTSGHLAPLLDNHSWLSWHACGSRSSFEHSQPSVPSFLRVLFHCSPQWPCTLWLHRVVYLWPSHLPFTFTLWLFCSWGFYSLELPYTPV